MCEVIAKKRKDGITQSLNDHTFAVIEVALNLIDEAEMEIISSETGWSKNKIKDIIFFCCYFHDIGKATEEFKSTIESGSKSYHSLYSSSLFAKITDFEFSRELGVNILMLSILTHHSVFSKESSFKSVAHDKKFNFKFLPYAETFFYKYNEAYEKYMDSTCKYEFEYKEVDLIELGKEIRNIYEDIKYIGNKEKYKSLRLLYSYVLGIVNLSDWIASAKFNKTMTKINFDYLIHKEELCRRFAKSIQIDLFNPKQFQKELSNFKGSVLVEIPTGEGKTEGSLLWAVNNLRNKSGKIIYTLPTQTTSNKLYERTKDAFGEDTGLIHSSSKIYLEKKYEIENGKVDDNFDSDILFSATFNKGVTVSTLDSLLKYFLNIGRYNIATLNFLRSVIIIDEVHSYDFKLMGFIKKFLEICKHYKVPVCLMSASIPNQIKNLLSINNIPVISDSSLFSKKANYIFKVEDSLENDFDNIISKFNQGKNILIVRNNIKRSVGIFQELKNKGVENIILYNSQFKKKDRVKKEDEIYNKLKSGEHFILVATQVVEISLDIDFEIMFTDNAPIDSLIQRFGRVNRKKKEDKLGEIFIYKDTDINPYYIRMLEITFENIEEGLFPLGKYNEWLNNVYDEIFNDKVIINELQSKFVEGYEKYDTIIKELYGISKSEDIYNLRDIEYPKKDFLLSEDYDENNFDYENTISLPAYLGDKKNGHVIREKDYIKGIYYDVLNFDYSYELGVTIEDSMFY